MSEQVLSKRGKYISEYEDFLVDTLLKVSTNAYHPTDNPNGVVNMGTATNKLMEAELETRLNQGDCLHFKRENQHYCDFSGDYKLKVDVANFFSRHLSPRQPIIPQNMVIMCGVTSCLDAMAHVLCDPGDVIITPTPVYARIYTDLHDHAGAILEPLPMTEKENENGESFSLDPAELEKLIVSLRQNGRRVRGFVLLNPHNPLGDVYSKDLLLDLLRVCAKHEVHFISDEIYALSVFDEKTQFISVLSLGVPDPARTHLLWGFSKDFGLAAFRTGIIYSLREDVVKALEHTACYKCVPHLMQQAASTMINDIAWCDQFYLPTNLHRLKKAYERARDRIESIGSHVRPSKAGLFIWFSIHSFLPEVNEDEEMKLLNELLDAGLYIVPGTQMYCQNPGWFRMIFSVTPNELDVGLDRLENVLKNRRQKTP